MKGYPIAGHPLARTLVKVRSTVSGFAVGALLVLTAVNQPTDLRIAHPDASGGLHGRWQYAVNHPCRTEDSVNCYWDAQARGNHRGHSFYVITQWLDEDHARGSKQVCVFFWDRTFARAHDNCSR